MSGANIGVFSLFAALSGAKKIYAFEPSSKAYQTLCENIELNNLTGTIIPINKAVRNADDLTVQFPVPSLYNKIESVLDNNQENCCEIQTVTLNSFICENDISSIDLLKLDCEGAEFDIVPSLNEAALARINAIRMECHGEPDELINNLSHKGFVVDLIKKHRAGEYDVWLTKRRS